MTVKTLAETQGFSAFVLPEPEREIEGVYICDLLSWVMGKATSGVAWITIMSNVNVLAVASLTDVSCVILAEGVTLEQEILNTAREKGINIISTKNGIYETAVALSQLL